MRAPDANPPQWWDAACMSAKRGRGDQRLRAISSQRVWLVLAAAATGTAIGLGGGLALGRAVHDQSSEQKCPTAHDVSSQLMTSIGAKNRQLDLTSTLEVQMKSVNPPNPTGSELDLTSGAPFLSGCFLRPGAAKLIGLAWANGSMTATLDLHHRSVLGAPPPDDGGYKAVTVTVGQGHSDIRVALCEGPTAFWGLVCGPASKVSIEATVDNAHAEVSPDKRPVARPFPHEAEQKDNTVIYRWEFAGPAPPVTVSANVSLAAVASQERCKSA